MKIVYTELAVSDLTALYDFIAEESPQNASLILERIKSSILKLKETPEIGRPGRVPETRELIVPKTPFIIPYKVIDFTIYILRIYHTSRKWPETF